jgi:hypothetical protein
MLKSGYIYEGSYWRKKAVGFTADGKRISVIKKTIQLLVFLKLVALFLETFFGSVQITLILVWEGFPSTAISPLQPPITFAATDLIIFSVFFHSQFYFFNVTLSSI